MDNEFILNRVISRLPFRQWLVLERVSDSWHQTISRSWRSIKSLSIGNDLFDPESYPIRLEEKDENEICMIIRRCGPFLTRLHLAPVNVRKPFFRNVHRFTARHELSEKIFSDICLNCPNLKILDLSYHIFSNWKSFEILSDVPIGLEVLLLEICRLDESPPSETGMTDLMNLLFDRLINLKCFSIWGSCYGYWTVSETDFFRSPRSLTYLDLSQGFTAKIGSLKSWIPNLINLQQLHLERTSIDNDDLKILVETCPLRGLTLAYAKSITDFTPIASFSNLKYLRLDGNRDFLTDSALGSICQSCPELYLLSIENCSSLTSASLKKIGSLRKLRHLSVCSILSVDDDFLIKISQTCAKLKSLQLKYCRKLTRAGLIYLPDLERLKYLGVSGLAAFDQSIAECLRSRCKKLSTIEAFNCINYR